MRVSFGIVSIEVNILTDLRGLADLLRGIKRPEVLQSALPGPSKLFMATE
jgi:hypothetical protein